VLKGHLVQAFLAEAMAQFLEKSNNSIDYLKQGTALDGSMKFVKFLSQQVRAVALPRNSKVAAAIQGDLKTGRLTKVGHLYD